MGGIAGTLKFDGSFADKGDLARANTLLTHRGPNGRGVYLDRELGLAQTRMAALDLTDAGHQPMCAMGERYWIVYDGELYNFQELKEELKARGYQFSSQSDTEVVLAAFLAWGPQCVNQFNGMWAFAIWDVRERKLYLFRDAFGIKPLYYYHDKTHFAFASEVKGLIGFESIHLTIDKDGVATVLNDSSSAFAKETTPWKGVKRVLPGHYLVVDSVSAELTLKRWWYPLDRLPDIPASPHAQAERFKELLLTSCRRRMQSDIPLGVCLSGGLNSSALCYAVHTEGKESFSRKAPDWRAVCQVIFPEDGSEEVERGADFAASLEARFKKLKAYPDEYFKDILELIFAFESLDSISLERWILFQALRQEGIRIAMDAAGSGEVMGSLSMAVHYYAYAQVNQLFSAKKALNSASEWKQMLLDKRVPKISSLQREEIFQGSSSSSIWEEDREKLSQKDLFFQARYYAAHAGILQKTLHTVGMSSMSHGVVARLPFLDPDLFCYCLALPAESLIFNGTKQFILRNSLRGGIPESILSDSSQHFLPRLHEKWFEKELQGVIRECASSFYFRNFTGFDGNHVQKLLQMKRYAEAWPYIQTFLLNDKFREVRDKVFPD
jgi:asparagine synthase (glutamine-hydrolysing)